MAKKKYPYAVLKIVCTTEGVESTAFVDAKTWLHTVTRGSNCMVHSVLNFGDGNNAVWANKWNARLEKIVYPKK